MFFGSIAALVTPFKGSDGALDEATYADLIARQIAEGTTGLVVAGIVGEGPTLSIAEKLRLVRIAADCASKRVPVIVASGTYSTAASVALTAEAAAAGADAALVVTPYYNRPGQEGLYRHVEAIARSAKLPILLENAPGRTAAVFGIDTVGRLARAGHISGLIGQTVDPARLALIADVAGPHFVQLSSDDATAAMARLAGVHGCVSAAANIVPRLCADLQRACGACDIANAAALQRALLPLATTLSQDPDPALIKHAMVLQAPGWRPGVRLPMVAASRDATASIEAWLGTLAPCRAAFPTTDG